MSFIKESYQKHAHHFQVNDQEIELRFRTNSIDRWRHARMYDSINALIQSKDSWLTVGDGRYGSDSFFLKERGVQKILPTDISDNLLKIGKEAGIISEYRIENAESLSFQDNNFDWVFCKEAFHHFPRPMIAVYEMLRVAKKGVILIEPNDQQIESRHRSSARNGFQFFKRTLINSVKRKMSKELYYSFGNYEKSGNYVYTTSQREFEKVALGIDLPWVAFKGLNDHYEKGYETEPANNENQRFKKVQHIIKQKDLVVKRGDHPYGILVSVIGKSDIDSKAEGNLLSSGFEVKHLSRNPYLNK